MDLMTMDMRSWHHGRRFGNSGSRRNDNTSGEEDNRQHMNYNSDEHSKHVMTTPRTQL